MTLKRERPLSPHLQVYRFQITMTLSILHRATGVALAVGAFGLAWWLVAMAFGGEAWGTFDAVVATPFGMVLLFAFSACLVYHLLNGIRHLLWDIGWGFEIPQLYASGWTVVVLALVVTALIWFAALGGVA